MWLDAWWHLTLMSHEWLVALKCFFIRQRTQRIELWPWGKEYNDLHEKSNTLYTVLLPWNTAYYDAHVFKHYIYITMLLLHLSLRIGRPQPIIPSTKIAHCHWPSLSVISSHMVERRSFAFTVGANAECILATWPETQNVTVFSLTGCSLQVQHASVWQEH